MAIETIRIADHEITQETEDFFIYRFPKGTATGPHVTTMAALEQRQWSRGYIYNITVLGDDLSISPGALTTTAKIFRHSPPRSTAFVARRFFLRTSMEFLTRTIRLGGVPMNAAFFDDEPSARAWIAEQMQARRERQRSRPDA